MPSTRSARASSLAFRFGSLISVAGASLALSTPALAEPSPALDRFSFSVGAFGAEPTFSTSVNTQYGRISPNDVERGTVTLPRIQAEVLFGDSQGLSFDYFRYNKDLGVDFSKSFAVGPTSVTALGNLNLGLKADFGKVAYKYWIGSGNTVLGLGAGLAYYRVELNTSGNVGALGLGVPFSTTDKDDAVAPLLEIGVRHAISPDLRLFADASGIRKNGSGFHGSIYNAALGVEWFPVKNVGLVVSYGVTDIDLRRGNDNGFGDSRLRLKLQGPSAYLKARF